MSLIIAGGRLSHLILNHEYTREDVHKLFNPEGTYSPKGIWALRAVIPLGSNDGDYVFFVTLYGSEKRSKDFFAPDGSFLWVSEPSQRLQSKQTIKFINHDPLKNSIYLLLRANKFEGYTYLGRLGYVSHDKSKQQPIFIKWRLLDGLPHRQVLANLNLLNKSDEAAKEGPWVCKENIPSRQDNLGSDDRGGVDAQISVKSHQFISTEKAENPQSQLLIHENENSPSLKDVVASSGGSVRLKNILKNPSFPFKNVKEYLKHFDPSKVVRGIQNAGAKTASELNNIIQSFISDESLSSFRVQASNSEEIDFKDCQADSISAVKEIFSRLQFPDFMLTLTLSARLENTLRRISEDSTRGFKNFSDCILSYEALLKYFRGQSNVGRKTAEEFEQNIKLIFTFVLSQYSYSEAETEQLALWIKFPNKLTGDEQIDLASLHKKTLDLLKNVQSGDLKPIVLNGILNQGVYYDLERLDDAALAELIKRVVREREYDVINRRYAIEQKNTETFDEIAKTFGCTRERIRQIEKKALKKLQSLKPVFLKILENEYSIIEGILFEDSDHFPIGDEARQFKILNSRYQVAIDVVHGSFERYLKQTFKAYKGFWIRRTLESGYEELLQERINKGDASRPVDRRIVEALYECSWPVTMAQLSKKLPEFSKELLASSLRDEINAANENGMISFHGAKLKTSLRIILILKKAATALTLAEIRALHNDLFEYDITEHHVSSVVNRLAEALIVERGKYDLYENLTIKSEQLKEIRKLCKSYLKERRVFASAKRIYEDLFEQDHPYGDVFNPYMLLGILQDDNDFVCKRGQMIGLSTFSDEDFVSLNSSIYALVDARGPIDLRTIQEHLAKDRKVLDVTVNIVLEDSPHHVKTDVATFDRIDRAIGSDEVIERLKRAVEICLIDGDSSLFAIEKQLHLLNFKIDKYTLKSWLDKQDNLERDKSIVHLNEACEEVQHYQTSFKKLKAKYGKSLTADAIKKELPAALVKMPELDYRLLTSQNENPQELEKLLKEFEF